jgi:uncharacterized protein (TIGR02466 family)
MQEHVLYSLDFQYHTDVELAKKFIPIANKFLADPSLVTNTWNYKNTYTPEPGIAEKPELAEFKAYILKHAKDYLNKKNIKLHHGLDFEVSIFVSEMVKGDQHEYHDHPGALLSGLLYLEVPYGSAPLQFYNPRSSNKAWVKFLEPTYAIENELYSVSDNHNITVKPHQGLFVFWESWADHKVPVNNSSLGRKTIVFNVGVKDA